MRRRPGPIASTASGWTAASWAAAGCTAAFATRALEIGYWVHAAFLRRGIATEAVRRLCAEAFDDEAVQRVEIHHDRANFASGRVAAAAGFELVGERPDERKAPGEEGIECVWRLERARYARAG